jgi:hypothetical protein
MRRFFVVACVVAGCGREPPPSTPPPIVVTPPPPSAAPIATIAEPPPDAGPAPPKVTDFDLALGMICILLEDKRVACAGDVNATVVVDGIPPADMVRAGFRFACARAAADHALWCWGDDGTGKKSVRKIAIGAVSDFRPGESHVCALREADGAVLCWGTSRSGECGRGPTEKVVDPPNVVFKGGVRQLFGGSDTSCIRDVRDLLMCWGGQDGGYNGHGETATPRLIRLPGVTSPVRAMSFASGHSCLLTEDGAVMCRGWNPGGELGSAGREQWPMDGKGAHDTDFEPDFKPIKELSGSYVGLAAARHETCVLDKEGHVLCIGSPSWKGQHAHPCVIVKHAVPPPPKGTSFMPIPPEPTPICSLVPEPGFGDVVALRSTFGRRCALDRAGVVRCVGYEGGYGRGTVSTTPVAIDLP